MATKRLPKDIPQELFDELFPEGLTDITKNALAKNGYKTIGGTKVENYKRIPPVTGIRQDIPDFRTQYANARAANNGVVDPTAQSTFTPLPSNPVWRGGEAFPLQNNPSLTSNTDAYYRTPQDFTGLTPDTADRSWRDDIIAENLKTENRPPIRTQAETDAMIQAAREKGNAKPGGTNSAPFKIAADIYNQVRTGTTGNPLIDHTIDATGFAYDAARAEVPGRRNTGNNPVKQQFSTAGIPLANNTPVSRNSQPGANIQSTSPTPFSMDGFNLNIPVTTRPAAAAAVSPVSLAATYADSQGRDFDARAGIPNQQFTQPAPVPATPSLWDRFRAATAANGRRQEYSNPFDEFADPNNYRSGRR